jgi:hypothetical protein
LASIALDDSLLAGVSCPTATLAPSENMVCTGNYLVTQANVDDGEIVNVATVTAVDPSGTDVEHSDRETTELGSVPSLDFTKNVPTGDLVVGSTLTWTFDVVNTGAMTLTDVTVADSQTGPVTCAATSLAPGASTVCSATSVLTQAESGDTVPLPRRCPEREVRRGRGCIWFRDPRRLASQRHARSRPRRPARRQIAKYAQTSRTGLSPEDHHVPPLVLADYSSVSVRGIEPPEVNRVLQVTFLVTSPRQFGSGCHATMRA